MAVHAGAAEILSSAAVADAPSLDDISKKVRKPYTITKSRESWTEQEHDKFLEALQLFDRDWKKIEAFVGSKTVIQIRSHAQKYFLKVQKNGTGEHVPPPRPKRKSAQPYPQKAAKTALPTQQIPSSVSQSEPIYTVAMPPTAGNAVSSAMPSWVHHMAPPGSIGFLKKGDRSMVSISSKDRIMTTGDSNSSAPSRPSLPMSQGSGDVILRAMPDFAEVYSFLGSVFDPSATGHLEKMHEMAPIDRETVLLLMRNLSNNLSTDDFEEHKLFLSVYNMDGEETLNGQEPEHSDAPVAGSQLPLDSGDDTHVSGNSELQQMSDSREVTCESEADDGNLLLQSCPEEMENQPYLEECALGSSDVLNEYNMASEGTGTLDDAKGEAEVVDMWWS